MYAAHDVRYEERPEPTIIEPTDAVIRAVASCVCGSDLWRYRGISPMSEPAAMGHEFVGIVEEVGEAVTTLTPGQFVVGGFLHSDNTCPVCRKGMHASCQHGGGFDGCQAERIRIPNADGTLLATPAQPDEDLIPSLLALSDVMCTGWHAAVCAGVTPGATVVVVGDGAEGIARIKEMTDGIGADCVLECVGTEDARLQAVGCVRPGGQIGLVGVPHGELPMDQLFWANVGVKGGPAPVRAYLPHLLDMVWNRVIDPGKVFDLTLPLSEVVEAYRAMDERRAIKVMLRP